MHASDFVCHHKYSVAHNLIGSPLFGRTSDLNILRTRKKVL